MNIIDKIIFLAVSSLIYQVQILYGPAKAKQVNYCLLGLQNIFSFFSYYLFTTNNTYSE